MHLNEQQQAAVTPKTGILLVCAGAGSGKTRVITQRIINLIEKHRVPASSILALTFTNKAAREMRERVLPALANEMDQPTISTFHAYCLQVLKRNPHLLKNATFSLLDEDDREKLIHQLIARSRSQKKVSPQQVAAAISQAKNNAFNGWINFQSISNPLIQELIIAYEEEKERSHCFDFDDLLLEVIKLFKGNSTFKERHQQSIRHLLVDEYQDTNQVQHALLCEMTSSKTDGFVLDSLCVVGDEDQSIYSWRGATVSNIINFAVDFPDTTRIAIEQNYRSTQQILDTANSIICHNQVRHPKKLWSAKQGIDRVRIISLPSDLHEGEALARWLKSSRRHTPTSSCAILYRSHFQSRAIEEALIHLSIPYKIIGGIQFYERQEIKDLIAYLRLIANPYDRISCKRVINTPSRGLGEKFEEELIAAWSNNPLFSIHEVGKNLLENHHLTTHKRINFSHFLDIIKSLSPDQSPSIALQKVIEKTNYLSFLNETHETEIAEDKIRNIQELANAVHTLEERGITTVHHFLDEVTLLQNFNLNDHHGEEAVLLMTIHAAKGLEFDHVAIAGLEEGLFPSIRSSNDSTQLEEERRLLYVGITRARERLLISSARQRYTYGRITEQLPSRFLREVDPIKIRVESFSSSHLFTTYFDAWFSGKVIQATNPKKTISWETDPFQAKSLSTPQHTTLLWKKHQPISHKTFGTGIIELIEERSDRAILLTIRFKTGIKKIDSRFVNRLD
ncbi:MAG: UvrD-helicase domain-containing protein [Candidatus Babeliaceae bacterium]|nr:UvrD-helicase domain-containing protein [Candidatus Babeliaceae bacterium]